MSYRGDNQIKVTCGDMMADCVSMIAHKVCMIVASATGWRKRVTCGDMMADYVSMKSTQSVHDSR